MNEDTTAQTEEPTTGQEAADPGDKAVPGGEAPCEQSPEEKIAALEAKVQELTDQYLRKAADFENFRKRMIREKQETTDFANQNLFQELIIPMIDDLERAIEAAGKSAAENAAVQDLKNFSEGIVMIEKRLLSQLENKWGLKRFDSAGEPFDPNRHEAIMVEKSAEVTEPTVQEDPLKGYTLKERVIRSAKVKVLMPETPPGEAEDAGNSAEAPHGEAEGP
ncbi:MAG: nucleotide exchange factor GrpE [Spirochaetaceae bacterium]|jgi:molecular chaperone GrpE|nr:nucleotide exchange factor GrpE [Spirochaetaceae bacterium]